MKNRFHTISYWKQIYLQKWLAVGCKSDTRQGKD